MQITLVEIMHWISQSLKYPCIVILLLLLAISIWQLGGFLIEIFSNKKNKDYVAIEDFIKTTMKANNVEKTLNEIKIEESLKKGLREFVKNGQYSIEVQRNLASEFLMKKEKEFIKSLHSTEIISTLGPMFGLLGTLIPLGPGILALGKGDTKLLSDSLSIAFDTTVLGVISASIAFTISYFRKAWYDAYMVRYEMMLEAIIDKNEIDKAGEKTNE